MNYPEILLTLGAASLLIMASTAASYFILRRQLTASQTQTSQNLSLQLQAITGELHEVRQQLSDSAARYAPSSEEFPGPVSVHLNRRGQIAQLHRRGETPRSIASALGISQGEVKLILKLNHFGTPASSGEERENFRLKPAQSFDNALVSGKGAA